MAPLGLKASPGPGPEDRTAFRHVGLVFRNKPRTSELTFPRSSSERLFVGVVLNPDGRVRWASSLLVGGATGSWASLAVESWITAFRERILDAHSSCGPVGSES